MLYCIRNWYENHQTHDDSDCQDWWRSFSGRIIILADRFNLTADLQLGDRKGLCLLTMCALQPFHSNCRKQGCFFISKINWYTHILVHSERKTQVKHCFILFFNYFQLFAQSPLWWRFFSYKALCRYYIQKQFHFILVPKLTYSLIHTTNLKDRSGVIQYLSCCLYSPW